LLQCRHLARHQDFALPRHLPSIRHLQQPQLAKSARNHAGSIRVELVATQRIDEVAVTLIALSDQN
jgi:hypothetical protein